MGTRCRVPLVLPVDDAGPVDPAALVAPPSDWEDL